MVQLIKCVTLILNAAFSVAPPPLPLEPVRKRGKTKGKFYGQTIQQFHFERNIIYQLCVCVTVTLSNDTPVHE